MSKRGGESTRNQKVKKRKGIKIRTTVIPDSDEEGLPVNVNTDYARLVQTRVTASGKVGSITTSSVPLLEGEEATEDFSSEADIIRASDPVVDGIVTVVQKARKKRKKANDSTKMWSWLDVRSTVLDEIISLDGPGDIQTNLCSSCSNPESIPLYRCLECSYGLLFCGGCVIKLHQVLPLHRLECWKGGFFDRTSLHSIGFVCYLGHGGAACPIDSKPHNVLVVDINGWHKLRVKFCTCGTSTPWNERYRQLLRMRWYPASFNRPRTAFTFDLLDTYHKVTLQGKLNLYDFYLAIMQKSDNQGRLKPVYRYHEISRCMRQWRHLKGIKRGGGAHQAHPLSLTPSGSLAIECPACPHPGRNLPDDWDSVHGGNEWIYAQFIAVDANFKLKSKNRQIKDPELGSGWSYFVENTAYTRHVANNPHEKDVTSCGSEFHAVNQANSRGGKDYIASGVVKAVCARHCFVLPNAVGDLQRGERYINTDYIIATYLGRCQVRDIKISYDIACKWSINLHDRFAAYHEDIDLGPFSLTYLVPKFHLPAHGPKCHAQYSFNYTRGVGRTHGETVEQEWAYINLAALSTREMGPGARHTALDDSWGGWNWKKTLGLGSLLEKNLSKAVEMALKQRQVANDFTATFSKETTQAWSRMVKNWEADASYPNPYMSKERATKVSEARLRLTQEEAAEVAKGKESPHKVSASVFIRMGLELEDQQYALRSVAAGKAHSNTQKAILLERRGALLHQIKKWRKLQAIYMPGVLDTVVSEPAESPQREKAESAKLWLPSQLEDANERTSVCVAGVINSEKELRFGQLQDSLDDLRRARRIRHGLTTFHKVQLAGGGQKTQTKSRAVMQTIQDRINKCVRRYRVAREALLQLDPHGDWENLYPPLADADNRGPGKEPEEVSASDGQYAPSWIWRSNTMVVSPDEVNEDMRVEWAQCVARADRWEEEVTLLREEMRRVVVFMEWKSRDWLSKVDARAGTVTPAVCAGLSAYAREQGSVFHSLAIRFCQRWHSTLVSLSLPHKWATDFLNKHGARLVNPDFKKRRRGSPNSDPPGVPPAHPPTEPLPPITDAQPTPPNTDTINPAAEIMSDGSESHSESDESGSDSSSSWVE